MYEVLLERNAEKELRRLPSKVHDRIVKVIAALGTTASSTWMPQALTGSKSDWRIRVGDYRVVYEIADSVRIIRVHRVRHRSEAYR